MKNAIRWIMAGMLCMMLVAQGQQQAEEEEKCGGWLKPAFSIWCLTSRPSSGLERLYS